MVTERETVKSPSRCLSAIDSLGVVRKRGHFLSCVSWCRTDAQEECLVGVWLSVVTLVSPQSPGSMCVAQTVKGNLGS